RGKTLFCPNCGHKLEGAAPVAARAKRVEPDVESAPAHTGRRSGCGLSISVLLVAALVLLGIVGLGVGGVYLGLRDRARTEALAAEEHYGKGLSHLAQGEYELAVAEFEAVFQIDPDYKDVALRLGEAREQLEAEPTPTPQLQKEVNAVFLESLRQAHSAQDWPLVLSLADQLIGLDATYARAEVDQMLFDAFFSLGNQAVADDRMSESVRYFERALALQPGNALVAHAKDLATLYTSAVAYWGADWARASDEFGVLYVLDSAYKDVRQRTYEAHLNYAEQLAAQDDWCGAKDQYTRAIEVESSANLVAERQLADERCRAGTPSPTAESTGTPEASDTPSTAGTYAGKVVKEDDVDPNKILIRGTVYDRSGKGLWGTRVQIKAWDWSAIAVTNGMGDFSFDGLANPVTYTLTLLDVPSLPLDVPTAWGKLAQVEFRETR
ncbi:MAG: hypothetical protein GX557_10625, partial [Chloroflexi bacterium]|nr:hypothetical protein [Chloroflexota bacterium]